MRSRSLGGRLAPAVAGLAVLLLVGVGPGCRKELLNKEATHGLAQDPYPKAPRRLAPSIRILVWPETILEENTRDFERRYGVKVAVETFANDDEALSRITQDPRKYDLIMVSQYMGDRMRREGLLLKVPRQNEYIYRYLDTSVLNANADPRMEYFIPFDYAVLGVSFNIDHVAGFPRTWGYLSEHRQNPYVYGRMLMTDDMQYALAAAMLCAGVDPNQATRSDVEAARDVLIRMVRECGLRFLSEKDTNAEMVRGKGLLAVTWSGEAASILRSNPSCRFMIPEGRAILSIDGFSIPRESPSPETATLFIEFMLHPYQSLLVANYSMYPSTNLRTMTYVDRFMMNGPSCVLPAVADRMHVKRLQGEELKLYQEAWAAVKKARFDASKIKLIPVQ